MEVLHSDVKLIKHEGDLYMRLSDTMYLDMWCIPVNVPLQWELSEAFDKMSIDDSNKRKPLYFAPELFGDHHK